MQVELVAYGDTTGKCLEVLGQAVRCPERNAYYFPCRGHDEQHQIMDTMKYLVEKLELQMSLVLYSSGSSCSVQVTSTFPIGIMYPNGNTRRVR